MFARSPAFTWHRERAERAGPDPLRSVEFRLEEDEPGADGSGGGWTLIVTHASGHGEESAHVLEDRIPVRPLEIGEVELVFLPLFGASERRRIAWDGEDPSPVLEPVEACAADFLPQAPED